MVARGVAIAPGMMSSVMSGALGAEVVDIFD